MIKIPPDIKIYLGIEPIRMNKSFDGLSVFIHGQLDQNPLSGHLFIFGNLSADKIKIITWDRNGFLIFYKRLEKMSF